MRETIRCVVAFLAAGYAAAATVQTSAGEAAGGFGHFGPEGKAPARRTIGILDEQRRILPLDDTRDFEENRKGFIAPMKLRRIPADAGHTAWDMEGFNFIDEQEQFDSVHPSLHRIAKLNQNYGLYEVTPGIYQARGVIQRFLGYFDGNPANLIPLSPEDSGPLYVEMMGGADKIMARGKELFSEGKYLHASEILNRLVQAESDNQAAKDLLAGVFEQIGYQRENPGLRNSFLAAAYELRNGIPTAAIPSSSSPDVVRVITTGQFLDFLAIRMDGRQTTGMQFAMNLVTPDNGERYAIELSNETLTNIEGFQVPNPDLTLTINRSDLEQVMMGVKTMMAMIEDGTAQVVGDATILARLGATMVDFDPRFPIMPGTQLRATDIPAVDPYEAAIGAVVPE